MSTLLGLRDLTRRFGGLAAVDGVTMNVAEGEVRALIGPNGAGKTTLMNLIGGATMPTSGTIMFAGRDISRRSADARSSDGIRRTFQNLKLFEPLTVLENVMIGLHTEGRAGVLGALLRGPGTRREEERFEARAREVLELVGLAGVARVRAGSLAYGHKRLVEIARAIAARPRLLLLDEPAAGLNPTEADGLVSLVRRIFESGITIIMVEHHMGVVMAACSRITVLAHGRLLAEGTPGEIQRDPQVVEAYLGRPGLEERLAAYA